MRISSVIYKLLFVGYWLVILQNTYCGQFYLDKHEWIQQGTEKNVTGIDWKEMSLPDKGI